MGCISSVTEETKVVYQRNWDSLNAEIGCDVYKESSASFSGDAASLVVEEETLSTDTTIGFSFKSGAGDAVLLNMESPVRAQPFSVIRLSLLMSGRRRGGGGGGEEDKY